MLSERHYEHRTLRYLDSIWLTIKHPEFSEKYKKFATVKDREGRLIIGFLSLSTVLLNISFCFFIPEQTLLLTMIPLLLLLIIYFALQSKIEEKPWLMFITSPLSLLCFCLANGSHEMDRQTVLYQSNFKAALYLMVAAMETECKSKLLFHSAVAFFVPLFVQLCLMNYNPRFEDLDSSEVGHEDSLVFLRHVYLSTILIIVYYVRLRTYKATFVRGCLHEDNEKSIHEVLDQVSEPIIVIKRKHKISMKPKYMNQAAKEILQHGKLM